MTRDNGTPHDNRWFERQLADPEVRLAFDQERASLEFIHQLDAVMSRSGVSKAMLARRLGRSRAFVSQALSRGRNLTIKTMVELAGACGYELHVLLRRRSDVENVICVEPTEWQLKRKGTGVTTTKPAEATCLQSPTVVVESVGQAHSPWLSGLQQQGKQERMVA